MAHLHRPTRPHNPIARLAALVFVLVAGLALTGCSSSSDSTDTSCDLDSCTVTLDRGVDAKTEVLGVEVKLVKVEGEDVTLAIAGNRVTVKAGQSANVQGFQVEVVQVTDAHVKLKITKA